MGWGRGGRPWAGAWLRNFKFRKIRIFLNRLLANLPNVCPEGERDYFIILVRKKTNCPLPGREKLSSKAIQILLHRPTQNRSCR